MEVPEYLPKLGDREIEAATKTISDGWISPAGGKVTEFEKEFSSFMGGGSSIAVDSGTAALHLALESLDIPEGSKVIVPDLTYGATGLAVLEAGLEPVIADIEPETLTINPEIIEKKLDPDVEAIIVVHMYGKPAKMDQINRIAEENDLKVIEDACLAIGTEYRGKKAGALGDLGAFSFAWNKNITTGKGGMLFDEEGELSYARKLADYGRNQEKRFEFEETGYNYLMDNIRAAIGLKQLERLDQNFRAKKDIFSTYRRELGGLDIEFFDEKREHIEAAPTAFCIFTEERDALQRFLKENDIGCRKIFKPLSDMESFPDGEHPVSSRKASEGLVLPSHPDLSDEEILYVISKIEEYFS